MIPRQLTHRRRRDAEDGSAPGRITFLVWRDTSHPEGGGSELFVERVADFLAATGWDVTICCAAHGAAPRDEQRNGVHIRRRGGRLTVYPRGLLYLLGRAGRRSDVVVDVQNGLPFWTPLVRRRGVLSLVHHVHREQWQIIYPGLLGHLGWWLESQAAPRVYRRHPYVTVSSASRHALGGLGIAAERIGVVHNGVDTPHPEHARPRADDPTMCVLGRLVPHKQVEHALLIAAHLRAGIPRLRLDIIGDGWWRAQLEQQARDLGLGDMARFHGSVDDATRDALLDSAWLLLTPSVKEGWGIAIMEAAARGVPAIAYRSAGGVCESIVDGETGWLVGDAAEMSKRADELLGDDELRAAFGSRARERAATFTWTETGIGFTELVNRVRCGSGRVTADGC